MKKIHTVDLKDVSTIDPASNPDKIKPKKEPGEDGAVGKILKSVRLSTIF